MNYHHARAHKETVLSETKEFLEKGEENIFLEEVVRSEIVTCPNSTYVHSATHCTTYRVHGREREMSVITLWTCMIQI